MEKMKIVNPLKGDNSVKSLQEEAYDCLRKDELVYPRLAELALTRAEAKRGMAVLLDFQEDVHICASCPGLEQCPKATPGYKMSVVKEEGMLRPCFDSCLHLEKALEIRNRFVLADFPSSWYGVDLKDIEKSASTRNPLLKEMVAIAKRESSRWLYVSGKKKMGKSFILVCYSHRIGKIEPGVAYANSGKLFAKLREQSFKNGGEKFKRNLDLLKNASLLVLDEFGLGNVSPYDFENIIEPLLSYRAENDLLTAFGSTLPLEEVEEKYEKRLGEKATKLFRLIKKKTKSFDITGVKLYN